MKVFKKLCFETSGYPVDVDKTFEENRFDSLDLLVLITEIERIYKINIEDEVWGTFKSPRDIYNYLVGVNDVKYADFIIG